MIETPKLNNPSCVFSLLLVLSIQGFNSVAITQKCKANYQDFDVNHKKYLLSLKVQVILRNVSFLDLRTFFKGIGRRKKVQIEGEAEKSFGEQNVTFI